MHKLRNVKTYIDRRKEKRMGERNESARRIGGPDMKRSPLNHRRARGRGRLLSISINIPHYPPSGLEINRDRRPEISLSALVDEVSPNEEGQEEVLPHLSKSWL